VSPVRHLACIPDGNRRWARAAGRSVAEGHAAGIAAAGLWADAAFGAGVEVVSLWWGSPANLTRRSPAEVAGICAALEGWLDGAGATLLGRWEAGFDLLGRWPLLCPGIGGAAARAHRRAGTGPRRLVLLMGYDGRDELRAAAGRLGGAGASEADFGRALWTGHLPPVDLVLRTGGGAHLSAGFLLWGIAEARLRVVDALAPALGPDALRALLRAEGAADPRRYGA
jgi:undecaprenyl diphosphate synthase